MEIINQLYDEGEYIKKKDRSVHQMRDYYNFVKKYRREKLNYFKHYSFLPIFTPSHFILFKTYYELLNNVPFFNAGSIATYKKHIIDRLLDLVPLNIIQTFTKGYISNEKVPNSFIHAIERIIGIIEYEFVNINCMKNYQREILTKYNII